jgi:hypothetical protein
MTARATDAFEFVKGEDVQINWTVQTSSTDTSAKNITGWTLAMMIKRKASDTGVTQVTTSTSVTVGSSGTAATTIVSADTDDLDGDYVYDLWRTDAGALTCLSSGTISFIDSPRY